MTYPEIRRRLAEMTKMCIERLSRGQLNVLRDEMEEIFGGASGPFPEDAKLFAWEVLDLGVRLTPMIAPNAAKCLIAYLGPDQVGALLAGFPGWELMPDIDGVIVIGSKRHVEWMSHEAQSREKGHPPNPIPEWLSKWDPHQPGTEKNTQDPEVKDFFIPFDPSLN